MDGASNLGSRREMFFHGLPSRLACAALVAAVLFCRVGPADAAAPEISHIYPDYAGTHLDAEFHLQQVVTGENFSTVTRFLGWSPDDTPEQIRDAVRRDDFDRLSPPETPPSGAVEIPVVNLDGQVAVLPLRDIARGLRGDHSIVWAVNGNESSAPYLLNVAKPFWVSRENANPGDLLYVFGFGVSGQVALRGPGGVFVQDSFSAARSPRYRDPNLAHFRVPEDAPPGDYTIYVHNGRGGVYGWQLAGKMAVSKASPPLPEFDVRDSGAAGDGIADDGPAIRAAMAKARAGGIVRFPPGTFRVTETLIVPQGIRLAGAGRDQTIIQGMGFNPGEAPSQSWAPSKAGFSVLVMNNDTRLESLGVRGSVSKGSGGYGLISGDRDPQNITIKDCLILSPEEDFEDGYFRYRAALAFRGARRVSILDSDITGSLEMRPFAYRCELINNTFRRGTLMDMCSVMMPGAKNLVDANRFVDTPGRLVVYYGYRNYIRYNEMHNIGRGAWTNVPEPFLFHGGQPQTTSSVSTAESGSLTDSARKWEPDELKDDTVLIYAGRGMGQYRIVTGNTSDTLKVDQPWRVIPDATSRYSVGKKITENGIFNNQNHSPGLLTLWLDCIGNVVEKHRDDNGMGMYIYGDDRSGRAKDGSITNAERFHPSWYNVISDSWSDGSPIWLTGLTQPDNIYDGLPLFGNFIMHNKVRHPHDSRSQNTSHRTILGGIQVHGGEGRPGASHSMVLANLVSNTPTGVLIEGNVASTFVAWNLFHDVSESLVVLGTGVPHTFANRNEALVNGQVETLEEVPGTKPLRFEKTAEPGKREIVELSEVTRGTPSAVAEENIALGKAVTGSGIAPGEPGRPFTSGKLGRNVTTGAGPHFLQVDLGGVRKLGKLQLWNHFGDRRSYRGVIVQVSSSGDFGSDGVTLFNNDAGNLAGQGAGSDPLYYETAKGLTINFPATPARYIRCWLNGNSLNSYNHWVQLKAYEAR